MSKPRLASVIINNYNYGRFLRDAIESALGQTWRDVEVVVVDDGSVDDSRSIIGEYEGRVVSVLKDNGGQASAFNAGFTASRGTVVVFLDADDVLLPTAVERAMSLFEDPEVAKVHWHLWKIDEEGRRLGVRWPVGDLPDGDFRELVIREGPSSTGSPPTSGNAWARSFLRRVLPIPTSYRLCADDYLYALAPLFGRIRRVDEPQALYRLHSRNNYLDQSFEQRLTFGLQVQTDQCSVLERFLVEMGIEAEPERWRANLWFHRLDRALRSITAYVPPGGAFVLIDDDQWGMNEVVAERRRLRFSEQDGMYWGPPANGESAVRALECHRESGAEYLVIGWPSFWWLDYYTDLRLHLEAKYRCMVRDDVLMIFDLRSNERMRVDRSPKGGDR